MTAKINKAPAKAAAEIPKNSKLIPQFFDWRYSRPWANSFSLSSSSSALLEPFLRDEKISFNR